MNIDIHAQPKRSDLTDWVDDALGILRSRTDQQNRIAVNGGAHRCDIGAPLGVDRNSPTLQAKVVTSFFESSMCRCW